MKRFGVMLDMSRNAVMKPEEVKKFVVVLKSLGYNMIQLYTEDTYEVENEPYFGYLRGRYSATELQDIVSYCNAIGVEVFIACVEFLKSMCRRSEMDSCNFRDEGLQFFSRTALIILPNSFDFYNAKIWVKKRRFDRKKRPLCFLKI